MKLIWGRQSRTARRDPTASLLAPLLFATFALLPFAAADPTDYCSRWSHQSALVNGTIYIYGGQASQKPGQKSNNWNNDFLTLDVSKTWPIGTPTLKGLDQPSGPPAVANGYLWHSYSSLFLYGGEYQDTPAVSPSPYALWEYDIAGSAWTKHDSPKTAPGNSSDGGGQPVQGAAEGAGLSVPQLGRGWYFGGHLDQFTTPGWSNQVPRAYLKSMLEYTFPGQANDGVDALRGGKAAGDGGVWRNITSGGLQESKGFTERADGLLVYVPGFAPRGILLGLAGGTNETFTEMNVVDVYDVATSTWYKQATAGPSPPIRVNPCAVAASAPDGSSTNIYMYGGQNLVPFQQQIQYDDLWILTVPSFTWIQVDTSKQSTPPARAGHSCEVWDGQMVVVGGYVGTNISCDSPGIYIFDMTHLEWKNEFTALPGDKGAQGQQAAQAGRPEALSGSYGYQVPAAVQSVVGGNGAGGATATTPARGPAAGGPLATGTGPLIYAVTTTALPGAGGGPTGPNVAAIAAGTVAGVLFVVACYLGFCAWVYRRQLQLYKNHVAAGQRHALAGGGGFGIAGAGAGPPGSAGAGEKAAFLSSTAASSSAQRSSGAPSGGGASGGGGVGGPPGAGRRSSEAGSSTEDLLRGQEPSFIGVLLSPRRSLRIVNRD